MTPSPDVRLFPRLHPWLRHLRVHFNLLLTPIWAFGLVHGASAAGVDAPLTHPATWLAWASLHLFLYGGTTAFNSFYDRDEGPVGGMLEPPEVDAGLLPFSLVVQALGLALAVPVGVAFTLAWLALFVVFTAYSHPSVRLKAHPGAQLAAIGLGQGSIGFALGWLVFAAPRGLLEPTTLLRMALTASIVLGLYVVTQSYQVQEDAARGDRTLPVLLGPRRALRAAVAFLAPGGIVLLADLGAFGGRATAAAAAAIFVVLAALVWSWSGRFDPNAIQANYRTAMRVTTFGSVSLTLLLTLLLLR